MSFGVDVAALADDSCGRDGCSVTVDPLPFEGRPHWYIADPFGNRIELIG